MGQYAFSGLIPARYMRKEVLSESAESITLRVFDQGLRSAEAVLKLRLLSAEDRAGPGFSDFWAPLRVLRHPLLSTPYAHGTIDSDGQLFGYTVRPFLHGVALSHVLPLPDPIAVRRVAQQICSGLGELHGAGFLHQDLKPANVIVRRSAGGAIDEQSQCVLIDLTFRGSLERGDNELRDVTIQYVAPELLDGAAPDVRSDLYSLGVLLYEVATGHLPFAGVTISEILTAQRQRHVRPQSGALLADPELARLINALLEPNPENRPQSATEVALAVGTPGESADQCGAPVEADALLTESLFLGRDVEVSEVLGLAATRGERGVVSIEVCGRTGMGVTTFLREIQDHLEAAGTASVVAHLGRKDALLDQLARQLPGVVRTSVDGDSEAPRPRPARTAIDLLDDLLVATESRDLVVIVDDWDLGGAAERSLLTRALNQERVCRTDGVHRRGQLTVILGCVSPDPVLRESIGVDRVHELSALSADSIERISALMGLSDQLSRMEIRRLTSASEGVPSDAIGRLRAFKRTHDRSQLLEPTVRGGSVRTDDIRRVAIGDDGGAAQVGALVWVDQFTNQEWLRYSAAVGEDAVDLSRRCPWIEPSSTGFSVRRVDHPRAVLGALPTSTRRRITDAIRRVLRPSLREAEPDRLEQLLRVVLQTGGVTAQLRWPVLSALIRLMRAGRLAGIVEFCERLDRHFPECPWWSRVFLEGARVEGGSRLDVTFSIDGYGDVEEFYRGWVVARSERRARFREKATVRLEGLAQNVACSRSPIAFLEDLGVGRAEAGDFESARAAERSVLERAVRCWGRTSVSRILWGAVGDSCATRAGAAVASYLRIRQRRAMLRGEFRRALAAAERERVIVRSLGDSWREAACLNNEGLCLLAAGQANESEAKLRACSLVRERLDDERGLAVTLNNLALALTAQGNDSSAISTLNRARVVAKRNSLDRHWSIASLNLARAFTARGRLREARQALRPLRAMASSNCDDETLARSAFLLSRLAMDSMHLGVIDSYLDTSAQMIGCAPQLANDLQVSQLRNELKRRVGYVETWSPDPQSSAREQSLLRRVSRSPNVSVASFRRLVRALGVRGRGRQLAEACATTVRHSRVEAGVIEVALDVLNSRLCREAHDDLQVAARVWIASHLADASRFREAVSVADEAFRRMRRLERKVAGSSEGAKLLHCLEGEAVAALRLGRPHRRSRARGLRMRALEKLTSFGSEASELATSHGRTLARLANLLAEKASRRVDRMLKLVRVSTGASRAILVDDAGDDLHVRSANSGAAKNSDEISWAIVRRVLKTGQLARYDDAMASEQLTSHRSIATLQLRSLICVPVRWSGAVKGALYLDHSGVAGLFGRDDEAMLSVIAGFIGNELDCAAREATIDDLTRQARDAHDHLVRAERTRMAAVIAGGLAHDLKNVLAAIAARSQLTRVGLEGRTHDGLVAIEKAVESGTRLLQKLQECSRDHSAQPTEEVEVLEMTRDAVQLVEPKLSAAQVTIQTDVEPNSRVQGVPGEIREVLLNLLWNAIDAAKPDGSVRIAVRTERDLVQIEVADDGVGMDAATAARAFEPFFTTKGSHGTGLGLAIVRSIVVKYGGEIDLKSAPGEGASFVVSLPAVSLGTRETRCSTGAKRT